MANMRGIMPALQKAPKADVTLGDAVYNSVTLPQQRRKTRVVKDATPDEIARELAAWISG
jgi:electron transfer flavoprotein beta subunit